MTLADHAKQAQPPTYTPILVGIKVSTQAELNRFIDTILVIAAEKEAQNSACAEETHDPCPDLNHN